MELRESEASGCMSLCCEAANQTAGNGDAFPQCNTTNHVAFYTYHRRSQSGGWCVKHLTSSACECAETWKYKAEVM